MRDLAIRVDQLSKQYTIGEKRERFNSIGELLTHGLRGVLRAKGPRTRRESTTFKALDKVSFEINKGEAVAIIGRNGSGKSTLLKILSRVTTPTTGRAEVYGRIGSLLEVGTGFHPELTGRENIYLNGVILGMRKAEIGAKFDEIVDFSGVEKFLDTPVKRYSSGMYVRLAFAVAAHLSPEILIIDEVLSVGDAGFQKKCIGKMEAVANEGRTIVFVSHNLAAVRSLCTRSLLLEGGVLQMIGPSGEVIDHYVHQYETIPAMRIGRIEADRDWTSDGEGFSLCPKDECATLSVLCGQPIEVEFNLETPKPVSQVTIGITMFAGNDERVVSMSNKVQNVLSAPGVSRNWTIRCDLGPLPLNAGTYYATVYIGNGVVDIARFSKVMAISVGEHDVFGWGNGLPSAREWGPIYWAPKWDIRPEGK